MMRVTPETVGVRRFVPHGTLLTRWHMVEFCRSLNNRPTEEEVRAGKWNSEVFFWTYPHSVTHVDAEDAAAFVADTRGFGLIEDYAADDGFPHVVVRYVGSLVPKRVSDGFDFEENAVLRMLALWREAAPTSQEVSQ